MGNLAPPHLDHLEEGLRGRLASAYRHQLQDLRAALVSSRPADQPDPP